MSEPPTLILRESEEERTLVDHVEHRRGPTRSTARGILSSYGRELIEVGVAFALFLGLVFVVYQQQQAADALREIRAEIRAAGESDAVARSHSALRRAESSHRGLVERRPTDSELGAEQRAELERRAAALVASNDFPAALRQYEALARSFPEEVAFRDLVTVLRAKLRCGPSLSPTGSACR